REGSAVIAVPAGQVEKLYQLKDHYLETLQNEYAVVEHHLTLLLDETEASSQPLTADCQTRFVSLLNSMPNGVIRMSDVAKGVVETSLNVGVVTMDEEKAEVICL
ncbi:cytosol nonspecific dipeptidase, partial [Enterobacter hormaechei]|nr:cytosol nonspecific dipeptidase [Enterobacter hormaechei]